MSKKIMTNRMANLELLRKEKRDGGGQDQALMLHQAIQESDAKPFTAEDARRVLRPKGKLGKEKESVQ